jgi:hypothetical protein
MIQHAFTSAYTNQVGSQLKTFDTGLTGVKDAATLAAGILGFSGALGSGAIAKGAEHALAGRVGGIGGNIMLATLQQKADTAKVKKETKNLLTAEEVGQTIESQLGDNPINRAAKKSLGTVFETLVKAKQEGIINKQGQIESSMGDIDPNSELGKKIISNLDKEDKK